MDFCGIEFAFEYTLSTKGCEILKKTANVKRKQKAKKSVTTDKYPSASVLLDISLDEYSKERERSNTIESKANAFISVIIAIFTIYIPIIPFSKLNMAYSSFNNLGLISMTVVLCVMLLSLILLIFAFVNLYKGYKVKPYLRVEFSNLNDDSVLAQSENDVKRALVEHYNTILTENAKINTEKAEAVVTGIKYSIIAFALLSLSAIALIIMIGGK